MSRIALAILALFVIGSLSATAGAADWPTLGGDNRRTGWSPEEIPAPVKRKWYRSFPLEGLSCGVQPVIADGLVYIGTMHGIMRGIDEQSGQDRWARKVGGGILHSAAVADGRVFFGAADGRVYALNARTGEPIWEYATGLAIWNAPVVADATVFIGGRDGFFYALNAADGRLRWRTEIGAPILCSPAYENGRVYFAGEDMRAYCLAADTGKILWSGQLYGVSARGYHPVIAGDIVFFVTQPGLGKFGPVDVLLEACRELGLQPRQRIGADPRGPEEPKEVVEAKRRHNEPLLKNPEILRRQLEIVRRIHQERPHTRTVFAFDKNSGREPWITPVCWQESCGGVGNPPIVAPDGQVYIKYALMTWAKLGEYFPYTQIGRIDLKTGDITPVRDPMNYSYPIGITHDEMARFTGAGNSIIHAREGYPGFRGIVAIDLAKLTLRTLGDNIHYGENTIGPMNILRLLKNEPIPPAMEYIPRGAGVFGGTGTYAAVSIANGTIYYIPGHEGRAGCDLIAWQSNPGGEENRWTDPNSSAWRDPSYLEPANLELLRQQPFDWDMLLRPYGRCWPRGEADRIEPEPREAFDRRRSAAQAYVAALSDEHIDSYIWHVAAPAPSSALQPLRQELAAMVRELIGAEWAPMRYPDMMFGGWQYFEDPTEIFTTLAAAWPLLPGDLQGQVRQYLRQQFQRNNPLTVANLPETGQRRTAYELPPYADIQRRDLRPIGIRRLYPLWAWASATGDWDLLQEHWKTTIAPMRTRIAQPKVDDDILWANDTISGLIAYARLARRFGDGEAETAAVPMLRSMLRSRIVSERTCIYTRFERREGHPRMPAYPGRYIFLTPELGRLVRDHALKENQAIFERYVAHARPQWYLAWGPMMYYAWETSLDHPVNPWATFAARALLFNDDATALQKYLDRPWCRADLYHIQKLAWTCMAR